MDFSFRKDGWRGATTDPYTRRLLPLQVNISYPSHEHHWGWRGKECEAMSRRRPAVHQSRLSDLPGASGGTGVRMAKEALRALSMDKFVLRPKTWPKGLRTTHPDHPGLWRSFSLSRWPQYPSVLRRTLSLKLGFLDTGVLAPPTQKRQP